MPNRLQKMENYYKREKCVSTFTDILKEVKSTSFSNINKLRRCIWLPNVMLHQAQISATGKYSMRQLGVCNVSILAGSSAILLHKYNGQNPIAYSGANWIQCQK